MNASEVIVENRIRRLGRQIGKGGEGSVFALADDPSLAVKLYTTHDVASREAKITAMVRAALASRAPLIAFPLSVARKRDGSFAGFVMKLIGGHKPLHDLYAPGSRKNHFPHADFRFLARTATNIARAIASVHRENCVIGDINHSGMLVSPKAVVSLIDADSFQVSDGTRRYLCKVGVPEYTPPELQGARLGTIERTPNHDAFGLAVVVFQLLFMGRHPFVGTVRRGDIPPLHENIRNFRYVYAGRRNVEMDQPPGTPSVPDFFPPIAEFFEQAFSQDSVDRRPSAAQWIERLGTLEASLVKCDDNPLHHVPRDAPDCPWCEMERELGTLLFLPYVQSVDSLGLGVDPGASAFNLEQVWARIERVSIPSHGSLSPTTSSLSPTPSAAAIKAKHAGSGRAPLGAVIIVAGVLGFIGFPSAAIVWIGLAIWGFVLANSKPETNVAPFRQAYDKAEEEWAKALHAWEKRAGIHDLNAVRQELQSAKDSYGRLGEEERSALAKYRADRRDRQLHGFLDSFEIRHTKISGIGPAKLAALASYGVDTAADVNSAKLRSVPGFGPTTSRPLLEWRRKLEGRFVYRSAENELDRQEIARIRSAIHAKAVPLRQKLLGGAHGLESAARRVRDFAARNDPMLERVHAMREQAKADLAFLGLPSPTPAPVQGQPLPPPPGAPPPKIGPTQLAGGGSVACPRCGSKMVRRLARRGSNAGNHFWGCSRYPSCKGTRS